jgi:hypothetical protein
VWHKELHDEYNHIQTDPCDVRRLVLSSTTGVFSSVFFQSLKGDKVQFMRFQADITEGSSLQCWMPGVHNIVILLLSREMVFFDIEFGVSVGSVRLSSSKPDFGTIIGGFGHETTGKHLYSRGLDVLLCYHTDASISTWKRNGNSLGFHMIRHCSLVESRYSTLSSKGASVGDIGGKVSFEFVSAIAGPKSYTSSIMVDMTKRPWYPSNIYLVGISLDGSLWKWDLRASSETPCLKSLQEGLSGRVSSMSVSREDQTILGKRNACFVAIGTVEGALEIHMLQKSRGDLFALCKLKKLQITNSSNTPILGVTWLGTTGKVAMYVSQKEGTSGGPDKVPVYRNIVKVVDVHQGTSKTIKNASEAGRICGIRSSPFGAYLLLWCTGIPSEIWSALVDEDEPVRVRQIELDFTSVEWLPRDYEEPQEFLDAPSIVKKDSYGSLEDLPEELLCFSLSDARLGVLLIKGRKIQDTRPVRPTWAPLVTGEFRVVSAAASKGFIFLGGADGTLARWEMSTGNVIAVESGCSKIETIDVFEDPCTGGGVKLALKSSSGTFAVLLVDSGGKFTSSKVTWVSGYSKVGYVNDIAWAKHPLYGEEGMMLMLQLREGGVCLMKFSNSDVDTKPDFKQDTSPTVCSMLLPEHLRQIMCILIQNGITWEDMSKAVLQQDGFSAELEESLRQYIPSTCLTGISLGDFEENKTDRREPDSVSRPSGIHAEDMPQGSLAELLKSRVSIGDDSSPGSPLYPTNSRNSTDKAIFEMGYRSSSQAGGMGDVSETFKSLKGSVKDIAVAGKEKVQKKLRSKDATPQIPVENSSIRVQSPPRSRKDSWKSDEESFNNLQDAIKATANIQALSSFPFGPLEEAFIKTYESCTDTEYSLAFRMALCARIQWSSEEEQFWMDLQSHLSSLMPSESEDVDQISSSSVVWQPQRHVDTLSEVSKWHSSLCSAGVLNDSEKLVEKCMIELLALGDIETAVSIQLATTPDISKRFYRDALCSLGMAYACACEQLDLAETDRATSLFVQAARVIAINAATGGDPLLSIPLLYATSKYKEVVDILQANEMWLCSACLTAKKLSETDMKEPLYSLAQHMASKQGHVWQALVVLIASQQYQRSIDLMLHFQMPDRAFGLVRVLEEFNITMPEQTLLLVEQQYFRFIRSTLG